MSRQFSVAYNQSETILAHYGLLTGYLCFSAQDFILIICHATIADETKAGRFSAAVGNPAYRKRRREQSWQQDATYGYSFGNRKAKHNEYNN